MELVTSFPAGKQAVVYRHERLASFSALFPRRVALEFELALADIVPLTEPSDVTRM